METVSSRSEEASCLAKPALLAPYLEALRAGGPGVEALESWESAAVAAARPGSWQNRVAEALAFRLRCQERFGESRTDAEPFERDMAGDEGVVDAALGLALQQDLKLEVDLLVAAGQVREAKQLTALLRKLSQAVAELKSRIGEEGFARAEQLAPTLAEGEGVERARPKAAKPQLVEASPEPPTTFKREPRPTGPVRRVVAKPRIGHLRPLLAALAVSTLVYMVFIFPRSSGTLAPRLELRDFENVPGVVAVRARPPSLFVEVDAAAWRPLGERERQALVASVGTLAEGAGYTGARLQSTEGESLGEWLLKTGARLTPRASAH
jgi:hypothetical protein